MDKVILKSKVGRAAYRMFVGSNPKALEVIFNEKNNFQCEVPTVVTFVDGFGKEHVIQKNWAQHLLDTHSDELELVEVSEVPIVVAPKVTKSKGRKNEEVIS
jgi:hypothetical protein